MTDLLSSEDLRVEREVAREPAKVWRNRVWHELPLNYVGVGQLGPGVVDSRHTWPSEIAAKAAWEAFARNYPEAVERAGLEYLGAFPVPIEGEGQ